MDESVNSQVDARILVVEDNPAELQLLLKILHGQGYEVFPTTSGESTLKSVSSVAPDLILLNIQMPGLDGYSVCEQLKANENTRNIPIIFVSGRDQVLDKVRAFSKGGVDYILKPYQAEEVVARIMTHLSLRRLQQGLELEIAERKRAAATLAERSQELARSNAELDQLLYVASHDLQEPLRMIAGYLQLLERRYKDKLDSDANEFIDFAVDGAKRMRDLINDLLTYSRVGTRGKPLTATDCGAVLEEALHHLGMVIEDSGAKVESDPLPEVKADATQLMQVFQNLIGNAIKFRRDEAPLIHIEVEREDGFWRFSVRDNGLGIPAHQFERVFVVFQRLHGPGEYPGTGIGLPLCKKIVERHGGRIWVESQVDVGSTFMFTLPAV
jgi:signal transduction histidine kinase